MSAKGDVRGFLVSRRAQLTPAIVQTPHLDLVAANTLGRDFYVDWPLARRTGAAILRLEAGRDPLNAELTRLIGELSTLSPYFREDWARRDVHEHRTGVKHVNHPEVGRLDLAFEVLETPGTSAERLVTYSADPGSATAEKLALLGSLAAESPVENTPARSDRPREHYPQEKS
nr:hypothetical protein [Propionicimonas sp.]